MGKAVAGPYCCPNHLEINIVIFLFQSVVGKHDEKKKKKKKRRKPHSILFM